MFLLVFCTNCRCVDVRMKEEEGYGWCEILTNLVERESTRGFWRNDERELSKYKREKELRNRGKEIIHLSVPEEKILPSP